MLGQPTRFFIRMKSQNFLFKHSPHQIQTEIWQVIWKVRTPHKVNLFVWKLMHDCLPTFLALKNRGICHHSTCPFCNEEEESSSHLFLHCTFTRACWHGSTLAIHTSDFNNISVQAWLKNIILRLEQLDQERMEYLCSIFTLLWTIWKHRNMVTHDGKTPNPTEVILTAQSLICRFKEAFERKINHDRPNKGVQPNHQNIGGCWDLIIKIAGARKARPKRTSFAYEASNLQGRTMFSGCASSGASTTTAATQ